MSRRGHFTFSGGDAARSGVVVGRRAVGELLDSGLTVQRILAASGQGAELERLLERARRAGIAVEAAQRRELDKLAGGVPHQGVAGIYQPPPELDAAEFISGLPAAPQGLLLCVDGIEDPRNLGAVIRSAEAFGAAGVVFRSTRASPLTPVSVKASAGAALRLPLASAPSLDRVLRLLKETGWWTFGLAAQAPKSIWDADLRGRTALVVGSEGGGLGRLVRDRCDELVAIPQLGRIASLNVSAAAAVAMAVCVRRRGEG